MNGRIPLLLSTRVAGLLPRPPLHTQALSVAALRTTDDRRLLLPPQLPQPSSTQYRSLTKTKRRQRKKMIERQRRVEQGLPAKPKPPRYIPKDTPVINALSRVERDQESQRFDAEAAEEMKAKMTAQSEKNEVMRFGFDGLVMSDRVKRLFDLKNGSQSEVVRSQKQRGMEVSNRKLLGLFGHQMHGLPRSPAQHESDAFTHIAQLLSSNSCFSCERATREAQLCRSWR